MYLCIKQRYPLFFEHWFGSVANHLHHRDVADSSGKAPLEPNRKPTGISKIIYESNKPSILH